MNETEQATPRRRWYQFSLRTLLEIMFVVACLSSLMAWNIRQDRRRVEATKFAGNLALYKRITGVAGSYGPDSVISESSYEESSSGCSENVELKVTLKSTTPEHFLDDVVQKTIDRLSELDATTDDKRPIEGYGIFDRPRTSRHLLITYQSGQMRGFITFHMISEPGDSPSVHLTVFHVLFH